MPPVMTAKYDNIGIDYNSTRVADNFISERLNYFLKPQLGKFYLDLGCGTGNYTMAVSKNRYKFFGIDPSERMLEQAKSKNSQIIWNKGSAELIPFEDSMFDGVIATLTIHHWTNLGQAFAEIDRVLAVDGRLVIFTSIPEQMKNYWLNYYFPEMLNKSICQMPSQEDIMLAMANTSLRITQVEKYYVADNLQDHFLYVGKNNPEVYFDESVRKGISSFISLSSLPEVNLGLQKLRQDLETQHFQSIKDRYNKEEGDYIFMQIVKTGGI